MDRQGGSSGGRVCYYSVLCIRKDASKVDISSAYRKQAMKWHPDKWTRNPARADEANRRFQEIQEAYSVLSDQGKKSLYDAGLYDPLEDDETEGFSEFMDEMIDMMGKVKNEIGAATEMMKSFLALLRTRRDMALIYAFAFVFVAFTAFVAFYNNPTTSSPPAAFGDGSRFSSLFAYFFPNSTAQPPQTKTNNVTDSISDDESLKSSKNPTVVQAPPEVNNQSHVDSSGGANHCSPWVVLKASNYDKTLDST